MEVGKGRQMKKFSLTDACMVNFTMGKKCLGRLKWDFFFNIPSYNDNIITLLYMYCTL